MLIYQLFHPCVGMSTRKHKMNINNLGSNTTFIHNATFMNSITRIIFTTNTIFMVNITSTTIQRTTNTTSIIVQMYN